MQPIAIVSRAQQQPIIVDVARQPEPTKDISVDVALSIFLMPFIVLAALAAGGAIVGSLVIMYKRWRGADAAPTADTHTTLRI